MTTTTNIDKMTRTTRQMTELQRDSFETLAKNFAALQRRNVELTQKWMTGSYRNFFPFTYAIYAQEGLKAAQQGTEQALEATQQVAQQGLRVAEEATAKAEKATVKAEKAEQDTAKTQAATREAALRAEEETRETREAALQSAVHRSLKTKDYEELNVDEVSKKLDGLSATDLKKVREYEEHNKNRETLIEQIDRKVKATA